MDAELDAGQDPKLWNLDEDEAEDMPDFEDAHAPGGPPVEATVSTGTQSCNGQHSVNTTAEEDAHSGASSCGAGRCARRPKGYKNEP